VSDKVCFTRDKSQNGKEIVFSEDFFEAKFSNDDDNNWKSYRRNVDAIHITFPENLWIRCRISLSGAKMVLAGLYPTLLLCILWKLIQSDMSRN
jgi:hypothetical protein